MASDTLSLPVEQVTAWLDAAFRRRNVDAKMHSERIKAEHEWLLSVPVFIQGILNNLSPERGYLEYVRDKDATIYINGELDAFDKASILQEVEDAWNDQEPPPHWKLLLIPAAN